MSTNGISNPSISEIRTDLAQNAGQTKSRVKEAPQSFSKIHDQLGFQPHVGMAKTFSAKQRKVFDTGTTVPADAAKNVEAIHNKLVKQTGSIANVFCKNAKSINTEFSAQLDILDKMIGKLEDALKNSPDKKAKISKALAEINGFLCRFNNSCVGGIDKSKGETVEGKNGDELKNLDKYQASDADNAERLKWAIEKISAKIKSFKGVKRKIEKLKGVKNIYDDTLKEYEETAKTSEETIEKNIGIVKGNIKTLKTYVGKISGSELEQSLNLIQKTCLSAWMFNDIQKEVGNAIGKEEVGKFFLGKNKKMLRLNQEARNTEMFQEVKLETLLGGKEKLEKLINKYSNKPYKNDTMVKFLKSNPKFGDRGRLGFEETQNMVKENQIANSGSKGNVERSGKLYKSERKAVFSTFTPPKTANLKTIKDSDVNTLNELLKNGNEDCKATARTIANALVEKGLATLKKDGSIEANPSYTNVINQSGLSSHCGPSGTTGEILSVLRYSLDKKESGKMTNVFNQIREIANTGECPKDFDCSNILSMVALFMEIGDFHTTAEAIGGLYSVAVADHNVELQDQKDVADRYGLIMLSGHHLETDKAENTSQNGYTNLLNVFKSNMSAFLEPKNAIA